MALTRLSGVNHAVALQLYKELGDAQAVQESRGQNRPRDPENCTHVCESSISTVYTQQFRFCFIMSKIAVNPYFRSLTLQKQDIKKAPAIIVGALEYFLEGLEGFLEHLETILEGLKAHLTVSHE